MRFALLLTVPLAFVLSGCGGRRAAPASAAAEAAVPVEVLPAATRSFQERIEVQGTVEARTTALVPARLDGTLTALFVDEGDTVEAGVTRLFQTDDVNLKTAIEMRRLEAAVMACTVLERAANREREQAALDRARSDYERQRALFETERIGTLDRLEQAESEFRKATASVKHADSLVALAREQERLAEAGVAMAAKNLSDATVLAPIDGVVSQRFQDVGEMGGSAHPVCRILDLGSLEVSAYLPAQHYAAIEPGRTRAHVAVNGVDLGMLPIHYRSPAVEPRMRVFEVRCRLGKTPPAGVAPGAMATLAVILRDEEGLGVPEQAIVRRGGGFLVFTVDGRHARAVPVVPTLRTEGWARVDGAALDAGAAVVVRGQFLLEDGRSVDVRERHSRSGD